MEHFVDYVGGDRGGCRHRVHRNGADECDDGRNDGWDDELWRRYGGGVAGRASADRHNCGSICLTHAAQVAALAVSSSTLTRKLLVARAGRRASDSSNTRRPAAEESSG